MLLLTKCCGIVGSVVEGRVYLDELRLLVENTLNKTGAAAAGGAAAGGAPAGGAAAKAKAPPAAAAQAATVGASLLTPKP